MRTAGRSVAIWTWLAFLGLAGSVASLVLLLSDRPAIDLGLALIAVAGAFTGASALLQTRNSRVEPDKLSRELDLLSERLLRLERRALDLPVSAPTVAADIDDLSTDIGLLSGTVASLVDAISDQERELALVRAQVDRDTPLKAPPPPERVSIIPSLFPLPESPQSHLTPPAAEPDRSADAARRSGIEAAFAAGRVELYLQPIVGLPQRRTQLFEASAHLLLAGDALPPTEYLPILTELGLRARLDEVLVERTAAFGANAAAREGSPQLLCNLSPACLNDVRFHAALDRLATDHPAMCRQLILEWPIQVWRDPGPLASRLRRLRDHGFGFAADRMSDRELSPAALAEFGIRFVRVPWDDLVAIDDPASGIATEALVAGLASFGIQVVADRVAREDTVPELIDVGIPLAQGSVFGRPRAARSDGPDLRSPEAREERAAAPATPADRSPEPAAAPEEAGPSSDERKSLRSLLRRAG
jgi:cyclic-di-GMP phosphodiesterase TipF (flagellum assembly factor)